MPSESLRNIELVKMKILYHSVLRVKSVSAKFCKYNNLAYTAGVAAGFFKCGFARLSRSVYKFYNASYLEVLFNDRRNFGDRTKASAGCR